MNRRNALRNSGLIAGAALVSPAIISLLQSCKETPRLSWQPQFLAEDEAHLISAIVDTLLPRTDTPGALDVKVDVFLDRLFAEAFDEGAQEKIRSQMAEFNTRCEQTQGKAFHELDAEKRVTVLQKAEADNATYNPSVWGTAVGKQEPIGFYRSLKSMTLWAYLSSEQIGEEVLRYDPIPQDYKGCIPLAEGERRWSL